MSDFDKKTCFGRKSVDDENMTSFSPSKISKFEGSELNATFL